MKAGARLPSANAGAAGFGASGGEAVRMRRREASGSGMGTAEGRPPRPVGDGVAASPPAGTFIFFEEGARWDV